MRITTFSTSRSLYLTDEPEPQDEDFAEDDDDMEVWPLIEDAILANMVESAYRGLMARRGQEARVQ